MISCNWLKLRVHIRVPVVVTDVLCNRAQVLTVDLFLCRTSKSQLRNIVNHACMQVEINLIKHFLNLLDCKLWCFIVFDHLCFLLAFQILPVNFMFIIITLFTVVRGFDAIIAVSSMTVQNKTLKLSLVCHPAVFTYFLRCTQALFALSKICVYLA